MSGTNNRIVRRKKLTAMEKASLPGICEKWNRIAFCTAPADREEAQRGAVELYKASGLKPPKEFVWFNSLDEAVVNIYGSGCEDQPLGGWAWNLGGIDHEIWRWAMRVFEAKIVHWIEDRIAESVFPYWSLWELLRVVQDGESIGPSYNPPISYGQYDVQWLAFACFFANATGIGHHRDLSGLMQIVSSCGFFWPGETKAAFFERPSVLCLDDQRRPHCLDGPAIQFRDGFSVYAIHGVPVPQKYIEIPAEQIDLAEVL